MKPYLLSSFAFLALTVGLTSTGCSSAPGTEAVGVGSSEIGTDGEPGGEKASCATSIKGVDVSRHNGDVDWTKVKGAGQTFAFARVSDGITHVDFKFNDNWAGMKRVGLVRGAYQFFRPQRDPIDQANLMLEKINEAGGMKAGDLPPVLDLEAVDGVSASVLVARAKAWIARIEEKVGMKPIVYTGNHMSPTIGTNFKDYVLWLAHYTTECPRVPTGWTRWTIWQNSESGSVPGVGGGVDTNFFNGTRKDLEKLTLDHDVPDDTEKATVELAKPNAAEAAAGPDGARMGDGMRE
jgi:lysozyme